MHFLLTNGSPVKGISMAPSFEKGTWKTAFHSAFNDTMRRSGTEVKNEAYLQDGVGVIRGGKPGSEAAGMLGTIKILSGY